MPGTVLDAGGHPWRSKIDMAPDITELNNEKAPARTVSKPDPSL